MRTARDRLLQVILVSPSLLTNIYLLKKKKFATKKYIIALYRRSNLFSCLLLGKSEEYRPTPSGVGLGRWHFIGSTSSHIMIHKTKMVIMTSYRHIWLAIEGNKYRHAVNIAANGACRRPTLADTSPAVAGISVRAQVFFANGLVEKSGVGAIVLDVF